MKTKKKLSKILFSVFYIVVCLVLGGVVGVLLAHMLPDDAAPMEELLHFAVLFAGLYIGSFLHTVVHEGGHLVFGLISGYTFVSFRIKSRMLCKTQDGYRLARYSLAGTGGQCLMDPPELRDGKMPYVLYNLGGVLLNLLASVLCGLLAWATASNSYFSLFFCSLALLGIVYAILNGIPLSLGTVNNDGHNAYSLGKDPQALKAFWIQLRVNALQMQGKRLCDMPSEWFERPDDTALQNSMIATLYVLRCNRLTDELRMEEADAEMKRLLDAKSGMVGVHRSLLLLERIYCALVRGSDPDGVLKHWKDAEIKQIFKMMKTFPSVQRFKYAYARLYEKDEAKAEKEKALFEKLVASYPYSGDAQGERELFALAENADLTDFTESNG